MMNLLGQDARGRFAVWERLDAEMPLRREQVITCQPDPGQAQGAFLSYHLKVDHRVIAYLMGSMTPDERLKGAVSVIPIASGNLFAPQAMLEPIYRALADSPIVYMQGRTGVGRRETAAVLCAQYRLSVVGADLARLAALDIPFPQAWRLAIREARLAGAALLVTEWESCLNEAGLPPEELWTALATYPYPVFICGKDVWEPQDETRTRRLLRVKFDLPVYEDRQRLWTQGVKQHGAAVNALDLEPLVSKFRFTPAQITRAVTTAADLAASRGESMNARDLYAGAQAHSTLRLGQLAKQIIPRHDWDDLILPPDRIEQLRELRARAEHTHLVHEVWGYGKKVAPKPSISALFAGESGTGKTMSAEVIANDLGLVMYRIDLSAVVSKYIGETEKNLSAIFEEARTSNAILFFDEADALFGKRSEVKDAHDRYANIETAYLLQQIEDYDGIAILATNLRQNLDEAFTRRLDFVIDFPFPDTEYRKRIWQAHFPPEVPLASDLDLDELAERYPLAGGNIRNAALASAFLAASDGKQITMQHVRSAVRREHQTMGRLTE
jgi:hypothetical protein